jgi:hypothetical protein
MTDRGESIACPHAQSEIDSARRYVAYYRVSPVAKEGSASASKVSVPQ